MAGVTGHGAPVGLAIAPGFLSAVARAHLVTQRSELTPDFAARHRSGFHVRLSGHLSGRRRERAYGCRPAHGPGRNCKTLLRIFDGKSPPTEATRERRLRLRDGCWRRSLPMKSADALPSPNCDCASYAPLAAIWVARNDTTIELGTGRVSSVLTLANRSGRAAIIGSPSPRVRHRWGRSGSGFARPSLGRRGTLHSGSGISLTKRRPRSNPSPDFRLMASSRHAGPASIRSHWFFDSTSQRNRGSNPKRPRLVSGSRGAFA